MEETSIIENKNIIEKISQIENENNIELKYKNITKLHKLIDKEENKLNGLLEELERPSLTNSSKYDDCDLEQIISKFEKTDNINKKIKYYHCISNKINEIINVINN